MYPVFLMQKETTYATNKLTLKFIKKGKKDTREFGGIRLIHTQVGANKNNFIIKNLTCKIRRKNKVNGK
jgi:hypothetical protein